MARPARVEIEVEAKAVPILALVHIFLRARSVSEITMGARGTHLGQDDSDTVNSARYWRDQAAQARATANLVRDPVAKAMMLDIANKYDHMAERASKQEDRR